VFHEQKETTLMSCRSVPWIGPVRWVCASAACISAILRENLK